MRPNLIVIIYTCIIINLNTKNFNYRAFFIVTKAIYFGKPVPMFYTINNTGKSAFIQN